MGILAALLVWQLQDLLAAAQLVDRADQRIAAAGRVQKLLVDMETGLRGYQLTGDAAFLEPYNAGAARIGPALDELSGPRAMDSAQRQRVEGIRSLHSQWQQYSRRMISQKRAGMQADLSEALAGKRIMDKLQGQIGALTAAEEQVRTRRIAASERAARRMVYAGISAIGGVAIIFVLFTLRQLTRLYRNHRLVEEALRDQVDKLAESESRFRAIFDLAAVGIARVGLDGRWLQFNRRLCEITGYSPQELSEKTVQELTDSEDMVSELAERNELLRGERQTYAREKRYVRKDGSRVRVHVTVSLVRGESGQPRYFVSVVEDISAREAERTAREASEARLKLAVDAARMGLWEWNLLTGDVRGSERQAGLWGSPPKTARLHVDEAMQRIHVEDRPRVKEALDAAVQGRTPVYHCEFRVVWPDGSVHWISADGDVLRETSGRATHIVGVSRDVTERREAERERQELLVREQRARAEAETANRRKDQFLAVLSHELRTPLTPVLARLALLRNDRSLSQEQRSALDMMRRNVELEARLIDDLLDITRIIRGSMHLHVEVVDAHEKIRNAVEIYQSEIEAKALRLDVRLEAQRHLVKADAARLQQVFWNLLSNAVKYTRRDGSITIRSFNRGAVQEGNGQPALVVEVIDTGIGIEPDVMARLFDPFEQGEQVLTRRFGGLGLGLSISRSLVNMLGGKLTAVSEGRDRGARFTVELRALEQTLVEHEQPPPAPQPRRQLRILLVEDNEDTLRVMSRLLRSDGYEVRTAASVKQAIDLAGSDNFDLLISDIGLPDGSGWELMKQLRAKGPVRGIALSGFSMEEDVQRSKTVGFMEHLAKPINPQELEEAILRVAT